MVKRKVRKELRQIKNVNDKVTKSCQVAAHSPLLQTLDCVSIEFEQIQPNLLIGFE